MFLEDIKGKLWSPDLWRWLCVCSCLSDDRRRRNARPSDSRPTVWWCSFSTTPSTSLWAILCRPTHSACTTLPCSLCTTCSHGPVTRVESSPRWRESLVTNTPYYPTHTITPSAPPTPAPHSLITMQLHLKERRDVFCTEQKEHLRSRGRAPQRTYRHTQSCYSQRLSIFLSISLSLFPSLSPSSHHAEGTPQRHITEDKLFTTWPPTAPTMGNLNIKLTRTHTHTYTSLREISTAYILVRVKGYSAVSSSVSNSWRKRTVILLHKVIV